MVLFQWSFGVLLWELFTYGAKPYGDMEGSDVVMKYVVDGGILDKPTECPQHALVVSRLYAMFIVFQRFG